jgi:HD superfamily phosphodiesterase
VTLFVYFVILSYIMKQIFQRFWEVAFPYQDKRGDIGHAKITRQYAQKLVAIESGDEEIVIPAITLHDLGWSQVKPENWQPMFQGKIPREQAFAVISQHQNESVRLAASILNQFGYPPEKSRRILEIILQHDTRMGFISRNEGLVRDADKLWRYSRIGFTADIARSGTPPSMECERLGHELNNPHFLFSATARRLAALELRKRRAELGSAFYSKTNFSPLTPVFSTIRHLALSYQDKRDDIGHHAITLEYARRLLAIEGGNADVVIPAIILHDIGWSRLPPAEVALLFDPSATREQELALRNRHQNESVRLAAGILHQINYPASQTRRILEIIVQHDTRDGFLSKNDGLVRDADKLWRFSETGFNADARRFKVSRTVQIARLEKELENPGYIYSTSAHRLAREELEYRKAGI